MVFDSRSTAKNTVINSNLQMTAGSLSSFDRSDFYKFQVNGPTSIYASLSGLTADASLSISDVNGSILRTSNRSGNLAESIGLTLNTGTYYFQISQVAGNTLYDLHLSSNALFANIDGSVKWLTGDFNGDSYQDVIRQEQGNLINGIGDTQFLLGKSDGSYNAATNFANMNTVAGNVANLIVGDFNGDGRDDLIRQEIGSNVNGIADTQILTFQNGNFTLVGDIQEMSGFNGNLCNIIAGDFNQDGRTDLIRQEQGAWIDNFRDVDIYLSTGGWSFSSTPATGTSAMASNDVRLVTSGKDVMRLERGWLVNGVSDVNFTTFANGNFQAFNSIAPSGFTDATVLKPWVNPIQSVYQANVSALGTLVSNQATVVSPYGTTGRFSVYSSGATIQWSAKTGTRLITSLMESIYKPQGRSGGWLGMPTGDQYSWQGGMRQDFEGGYLFRDGNQAVALQMSQMPRLAPTGLIVNGLQSTYNINSALQLTTSYAGDSNGWNDISKVDFWFQSTTGQRIELSDATSFTRNNDFWGSFQYGTTLTGVAAGSYTFKAIVYDKAGLAGTSFSQAITIVAPNVAPSSLQIYGLEASYDAGSTLQINTGYVWDQNGWTDLSRVDFWLTNSQNQRIELADVTSFTSYDSNWAKFSYNTTLNGLGAGNYKLCAIAYDKSGSASLNSLSQDFSILRTKDWFDFNIKDTNVANLARNAAADRDLSRNDLLSIFRDIQDGGIIDSIELGDIKTLVQNATGALFSMQDHIRYLANKVVSETVANMQAAIFDYGVMGKWFLGTIAPREDFYDEYDKKAYTFKYERFNGSLFGSSNQAKISGIDQQMFGNCVLFASLGSTFSRQSNEWGAGSSTINSMFINNGDDTYTVRFFNINNNLQAEWVTVDNRLPTVNGQIFGASNRDGLYVPIIEKAYAQWREWSITTKELRYGKSGWNITGNGDFITEGLQRIVGRSAQSYTTPINNANGYTFEIIQQALSQGKAVSSGSAAKSSAYLVDGHAYSVTNAYLSSTGERRVVVYNPWGIDVNDYYMSLGKVVQGNNDGFVDLSFNEFSAFQDIAIA